MEFGFTIWKKRWTSVCIVSSASYMSLNASHLLCHDEMNIFFDMQINNTQGSMFGQFSIEVANVFIPSFIHILFASGLPSPDLSIWRIFIVFYSVKLLSCAGKIFHFSIASHLTCTYMWDKMRFFLCRRLFIKNSFRILVLFLVWNAKQPQQLQQFVWNNNSLPKVLLSKINKLPEFVRNVHQTKEKERNIRQQQQ